MTKTDKKELKRLQRELTHLKGKADDAYRASKKIAELENALHPAQWGMFKKYKELKAENEVLDQAREKEREKLEAACMLLALNLGNIDDIDAEVITINTKKANKDANSWLDFIEKELKKLKETEK